MSKKTFSGGLNSLLSAKEKTPKRGRPANKPKEITKTSQIGTKEKETRATFIVDEETLDKLKAIAYWERLLIKEVANKAFIDAIKKYEAKNGIVKAIPKK